MASNFQSRVIIRRSMDTIRKLADVPSRCVGIRVQILFWVLTTRV